MSDWRPIETARKAEGETILGFIPLTEALPRFEVLRWHAATSRWRTDTYAFISFNPSHWMPLPEAPK